ncbi:N-acetylmuramoyl-L-alanine amidase family protein [Natribacillus halophilus]|uniref:N-acetylmuramoyl-L-alanine amidase n=1 Tax=Natribacillus halophilus TaxID=549003 RepID=A0A1G8PBG3_9BACI|nr:N-acetylmuramoyl-L-alanine amidase [Natribacillus halophilus]SDI89901.1 N-acetylmuramoyl-L-alanine amidase [Natribacillus halophilus]
MRRKNFVLKGAVVFAFSVGSFIGISFQQANANVSGETIAIDAGHGGHDNGATGHGLYEKELVYDVAYRTQQLLEDAGAEVIMTRDGDYFVELIDRANMANDGGADSFVSIHANAASDASVSGTETFHHPSDLEGGSLAADLQSSMVEEFGSNDRGVKTANFSVLRNSDMPAALAELGFVTNQAEADTMLTDAFRNEAANAIYQGLYEYH